MMNESTVSELSEESGLSIPTVRKYLKELHKYNVIHISRYVKDKRGNMTVKSWALGDKPDAKKPRRVTPKQACAKYRAKMKHIKLMQQMTGQYK